MKVSTALRYGSALAGLVLAVSSSVAAEAAVFGGVWTVSASLGHPVVETTAPTCVFKQSGGKISGTCKGPSAAGPAVGSVSGNVVLWSWHKIPTNRLQVNSIATYHGTFAGGVIRGTWTDTADPGILGTFVGQRVP